MPTSILTEVKELIFEVRKSQSYIIKPMVEARIKLFPFRDKNSKHKSLISPTLMLFKKCWGSKIYS